MVIEENTNSKFGKMLLKVAAGVLLPKAVDTFVNNTMNNSNRSTTETSNYHQEPVKPQIIVHKPQINLTVNYFICDDEKLDTEKVIKESPSLSIGHF